jgi:hypothetical protein
VDLKARWPLFLARVLVVLLAPRVQPHARGEAAENNEEVP